MDIATPPTDPAEAMNYPALHKLYLEMTSANSGVRMSPDRFEAWDKEVHELLRPAEITRLEKDLRPSMPLSPETIQYARLFHLTKILWARKGIEQHMTDTGF